MMRLAAVIGLVPGVAEIEVTTWVARGWVTPDAAEDGGPVFAEIDVARVRLIRDLRHDLGVAEDTLPLVLSLLDQVYELRATIGALTRAVQSQPEPVRALLRATLSHTDGER